MTDVRLTSTEFDRSPAAAVRLAEGGAKVIVTGADGADRAWLVPPPGCESAAEDG